MYEKLSKLLTEQLGIAPEKITPEAEIIKDLGADSLDVVDLMMSLEDENGITLPESDVEKVKTVQDVVNMLEKIQK